MMDFPPEVEKWRALVEQHFPAEDVEQALWVIQHESGGNADAVGDNGASIGLFQLNDNGEGSGMTAAERRDPAANIARAGLARKERGWRPWGGEGALFEGRRFGSLGLNANKWSPESMWATSAGIEDVPPEVTVGDGDPRFSQMLDEMWQNIPEDPAERLMWLSEMERLRRDAPGGYNDVQDQFGNKLAAATADINYKNLDLDKATADIERFLSGLTHAETRQEAIEHAQDDFAQYGTTGGKTDFSFSDLGGVFEQMAALDGTDPSTSAIRYPTTMKRDPLGDFAALDKQFGVTGEIPGIGDYAGTSGQAPVVPPIRSAATTAPTPQQPDVAGYLPDVLGGGPVTHGQAGSAVLGAGSDIWDLLSGGPGFNTSGSFSGLGAPAAVSPDYRKEQFNPTWFDNATGYSPNDPTTASWFHDVLAGRY